MMGSRSRRVFLCLAASGDPRETAAKKKKEKNWLIFRLKKNYVIFCTTRRSTFFIPWAKSTVATEGAQSLPLYPEGGGGRDLPSVSTQNKHKINAEVGTREFTAYIYHQGCGSVSIFCGSGSCSFSECGSGSCYLKNADPDPAKQNL